MILKKIPYRFSYTAIFTLISLILVFHVLILTSIIPFDLVWGGRLETYQQMIRYELFSIFINLCFVFFIALKAGLIRAFLSVRFANVFLWVFAFIFFLNTLGNLFSLNSLEQMIFTPVTLVLSILTARVAIEKV